jgi:hypothetical protein
MKTVIFSLIVSMMFLAGSSVYAEEPAVNISQRLHPNLAIAQKLCRQAFDKIGAAQKANNNDMEGHAQRAKELLTQVNDELKLAAEAANRSRR